jgi:hypothetical protein
METTDGLMFWRVVSPFQAGRALVEHAHRNAESRGLQMFYDDTGGPLPFARQLYSLQIEQTAFVSGFMEAFNSLPEPPVIHVKVEAHPIEIVRAAACR